MRLVKKNLLEEHTLDILDDTGKEDEEKINKLVQGIFESEKEILRRRGQGAEAEKYGDTPKPEDVAKYREQLHAKRVAQARDLEEWTDYLGGPDGKAYPTWYKYYVLRSLVSMGKRIRGSEATDTEPAVEPGYTKRSKTTTNPFPELDGGVLGVAFDEIKMSVARRLEAQAQKGKGKTQEEPLTILQELVDKGDFAKLYANLQDQNERIRREREKREGIKGEWRIFRKGDSRALLAALQGKGTDWCIDGREVVEKYLRTNGEFHVYFTEDKSGNPVDPRVAIRLERGAIAEVKGVLDKDQNIEGQFVDIAREKYKEFPGHERFEKTDRDMRRLTVIEEKMKREKDLTISDLRFLYEVDSPIDGFGNKKDPRIKELRDKRNPKEDAPVVLNCSSDQIAWNETQLTKDSKAYLSPLFPGIFEKYPDLEHLYTSFPEGRIERRTLEIGGKTPQEYEAELTKAGFKIAEDEKQILAKIKPSKERHETGTVRLTVRDLGFTSAALYDAICARAKELGLELCPPEVGPELRLVIKEQAMNDWEVIAMEPITGSGGGLVIFTVGMGRLGACGASPDVPWPPDEALTFCVRKP
ncbi:MAG: hypothetical protein EXS51_04435 [Candidatus Taylorbacteria bacterium]|nr:hypothetical protein [Candidatus Taylorbacteria bacterium]